MEKLSRKVLPAVVAMLSGIGAFAQGNGSVVINEATQMAASWFSACIFLIIVAALLLPLINLRISIKSTNLRNRQIMLPSQQENKSSYESWDFLFSAVRRS